MTALPDTARSDVTADVRELLGHRHREGAPAAVAHLSLLGTGSCVGVYDPDDGVTPVVEFLPLPVRGADLLEEIARIDENAPRLVANFATAFPVATDRLRTYGADQADLADLETPAVGWLLLAARLLAFADDATLQSDEGGDPVALDTVLVEQGDRFLLDGRRLLRSLMSYRIAGVEAVALSRSVSESIAGFLADAVERLLGQWPDARTVVCAGDLFETDQLLRITAHQQLGQLGRLVVLPRPRFTTLPVVEPARGG